jgi:hypothetical protein
MVYTYDNKYTLMGVFRQNGSSAAENAGKREKGGEQL